MKYGIIAVKYERCLWIPDHNVCVLPKFKRALHNPQPHTLNNLQSHLSLGWKMKQFGTHLWVLWNLQYDKKINPGEKMML
jgi:hypothetical protein